MRTDLTYTYLPLSFTINADLNKDLTFFNSFSLYIMSIPTINIKVVGISDISLAAS